jgi:hypothetical protein
MASLAAVALLASLLALLVKGQPPEDTVQDTSLEVLSRYLLKPEARQKFDAAAHMELQASAEQSHGTGLGYYDFGYSPDNTTLVSFRQTYGNVTGFLKARAGTKYIEARFANLTLPGTPSDLLIVATEPDAKVLNAMFGAMGLEVLVLQDYSFARPAGFRLLHSFIGASGYLQVTNLTAFDAIMRDIHASARAHEDGVLGLGVAYYHDKSGKVFAHLREAYTDPYHMEKHGAAVMPKHGEALGKCTNARCEGCFGRTYSSADQMAAVKAVKRIGEFYTLSGSGVTPMLWANAGNP